MVTVMRIHLLLLLALLLAFVAPTSAPAAELVTIRGSPVVARALSMAIETLSKDYDIEINFVAEANGLETVDRLGREIIDVGLYTRKLLPTETALHPQKRFNETLIGRQAVLVVVPDQVWNSGVRALTKEQFIGIYERDFKNWKQLGGEDRDIAYFNREVGRGVWDLFMVFLYGDIRKAPLSKAEVLNSAQEVSTTVEFNGGAISVLEYSELKRDARLHALGVKLEDGTIIDATPANIASGRYEMSRPLYVVTSKRPTGKVHELVKFLTGKDGQECVRKAGHVPLAEFMDETPAEPAKPAPRRTTETPSTRLDTEPIVTATLPATVTSHSPRNTTVVVIVAAAIVMILLALSPLIFRGKKRHR